MKFYIWDEVLYLKWSIIFEMKYYIWDEILYLRGSFIFERKFYIWEEVLYLRGSFIFERKYYICGAVFYIGWDIFYINDYMFYKCDMNYYMLKQVLYMRHKYYWNKQCPIIHRPWRKLRGGICRYKTFWMRIFERITLLLRFCSIHVKWYVLATCSARNWV